MIFFCNLGVCCIRLFDLLLKLWREVKRTNRWIRTVRYIAFSIRYVEPEAERRIIAIAEIVKSLVEVLDSIFSGE